jgi:hypothetical protein
MTTLEGHHPLIAIRTRGRKAALLLIAAVALAVAVAIAFEIRDKGGTGASQPSVAAKHAPATRGDATSLPPGTRYDGGPEEGTRGPLQIVHSSALPPGVRVENGPQERTGRGR